MFKKTIYLIVFFLSSFYSLSQKQLVVELLNEQVKTEWEQYPKGKVFTLTSPFQIDEDYILSFEFTKEDTLENTKEVTRREVPLGSIIIILKDYNLVFKTNGLVVEETSIVIRNNDIPVPETFSIDYFMPEISESADKVFVNKLIDALANCAISVELIDWE